MSGITLEQAETKLAEVLIAYEKALESQDYTISTAGGSRSSEQAGLDHLENAIKFWEKRIEKFSRPNGKGAVRSAVIR